ncbi:MAG: aldehyde ferredoxin oxidoreductase family protein [Bacillota bacterium]|nr:aldehyde ferredoxin oxidoreductase family protein [Bacillota bacterium]
MYGFYGKILEINLSTSEQKETSVPKEDYRLFLGGSGLAARLYDQRGYTRFEPLAGEAPLIIMTGILTGYNIPTACKAAFCGKSPATGIWAEAVVGGYWPAAIKTSGYDGLIVTGKAEKPIYFYFGDGEFEIRDASELWGQDVYATVDKLQAEHGEKVKVAAIGPAGENEVLVSAIMIDGRDARAAGRCGMGALMGSKNLKAIAVKKSENNPAINDSAGLSEARKKVLPTIREKAKGLSDFGTAGGVPVVEKLGDLPIRNWTMGSWTEGAAKVSGQAMAEEFFVKHYACYACPIRCGKEMKVPLGPNSGTISHGPEYETIAGFGAMCLNDDPAYVITANDLCNRLGIDTISGSAVIAFAMELYEHDLIPAELLGELKPEWGNGEAILTLINQIAYREGLGEYLGRGVKRAAKFFGPLAEEFAVESKGLEFAYHDPRAFTSMALIYATGNRGACHLEGLTYFNENRAFPGSLMGLKDEFDPHGIKDKPLLAKTMQDYMITFNALGICKFLMRGHIVPKNIAEWVSRVTGWTFDEKELMEAGERLFNLKRKINCGLGISRKDDTLSPRLLAHDRGEGAAAGSLPHLGKMLYEYYKLRGWSNEGIPLSETLSRLGLD